ncbi:MAG: pilus assembly protein TadG-related protein [Janthinobacterium lividum]
MKASDRTVSRLFREDSGQVLPFTAVIMVVVLAMAGLVFDLGRSLVAHRKLQDSTDAAALAGGSALPDTSAVSVATQYSALAGNLNASSWLNGVTMVSGYPKVLCLNTLTAQGMACASPDNGNALQVKQQINFPMTFLKLIGINSITMSAQATASTTGASRAPYNIAIIVDSTTSMNTIDLDSNCGKTRLSCALSGVQVLLQNLSPCAANLTTCGAATNGNVPYAVDKVALYTFPGLSSASQAAYEYDCNGLTIPTGSRYLEGANLGLGGSPTKPPYYQIVGFSSDYRTVNASSVLNSNSNLVRAIGGTSGCTGLQATVPYATYFAGVIYAAGYDLYYQQQANPGTQNVLVILGDGDANAVSAFMPNASTTSGTFASTLNECQQAVNMAQTAYKTFGMRVYSISYGAASIGCGTDRGAITPCQTMQGMASRPEYFYSDFTATGGASNCISASHSTTNLNQIFTMIANDLSTSRLIPDNTT